MSCQFDPYVAPTPPGELIDLGLPSGSLWTQYNLGVDINQLSQASDWYGDYYAWGELSPKESYTWENYRFGTQDNLTKYNSTDGLTTLQPEDDVVTVTYGSDYCMPSNDEFQELIDGTDYEWLTDYNGISGLNGVKYMKKSNPLVFIFLPASGSFDGGYGYYGAFWSTLRNSGKFLYKASILSSGTGSVSTGISDRCNGISIRAIKRVSQS